ncbi:unnamed protein product [Psylliodes chrysocephalus]|uniref:Uncharacterized protein n=1 Tax=Psylliodes chrysocephalus TaxID=3402493 RepID=A0A9P0GEQ2_9CUCU|nr:unnamed protein product [Psylliodes chrysocephala]
MDIWRRLKALKEETREDQKVAIHHLQEHTIEWLRKAIEVIFHESITMVEIHTTNAYKEKTSKGDTKVRPTLGMVVSGGATYKEILGKVKTAVAGNEARKAIRTIKSTKDGKMVIVFDKDQKAVSDIQKALKESVEGLRTRQIGEDGRTETLHVRGMDMECTREDLRQALQEKLGH